MELIASNPAVADGKLGGSYWALFSSPLIVPMGSWESNEAEDGWSVVVFRPS